MAYKIVKSDELMHYGVPGQKWGVINKQPTVTQTNSVKRYTISDNRSKFNDYVNKQRNANLNAAKTKAIKEAKYIKYSKNDPDFDDKNFNDDTKLGDTDYYCFKGTGGKYVVVEEDMKWELPDGVKPKEAEVLLTALDNRLSKLRAEGKKYSNDYYIKAVTKVLSINK